MVHLNQTNVSWISPHDVETFAGLGFFALRLRTVTPRVPIAAGKVTVPGNSSAREDGESTWRGKDFTCPSDAFIPSPLVNLAKLFQSIGGPL